MKLSINTGLPGKTYGLRYAAELFIDAGFDCIDFSANTEEHYTDAHDKNYYTEIRKFVEDKGVCFDQAHAPFASSFDSEEETEKRFGEIVKSMENASYLGVKNIVVHPCQHLSYCERGVPEKLFEINMAFYKKLIPYSEQYGIKVAIENMWQHPGMISHSTCSTPDEFVKYIDTLSRPDIFTACLDTGHAVLVRQKPDDMVRALGKERLGCLHVHDVDGINDSHTLPYFGIADWNAFMLSLAEIGYDGVLTYEAGNFYNKKPIELRPASLRYMAEVGRYLISRFEEYKKSV